MMMSAGMIKAAQFLGASALVGGGAFTLWIWPPAEEEAPSASRWLVPAATLGGAILLLFGALDLVRFARIAANEPLVVAGWDAIAAAATATRYGQMILVRAALALVMLAVGLRGAALSRRTLSGLLLAGGVGVLVTFSLASHAAASPGPLPLLGDLAHLAAATVWVGGLACMTQVPWRSLGEEGHGRAALYRVTGRFSMLGMVCVGVLALTGIYLSSLRMYGLAALVETPYGTTLLIKLVMFGSVVTMAAANRFLFLPGLRTAFPQLLRTGLALLQTLIWAEVVVLVLAFSFAGDLTAQSAPEEPPVRVSLTLRPDGIFPAEVTVPLGRRVRLTVVNETEGAGSVVLREFTHRLDWRPGAIIHRETLLFAPPNDKFWLDVQPGGRAVAEFTPLEEGVYPFGQTGTLIVTSRPLGR